MAEDISVLMELLKNKDITVDRLMFLGFCGTFFFIPIATSPAVIMGLLTLSLWIFSGKFIKDRHLWLKQKWFFPVLLFMALPWIGLLYTNNIKTGLDFAAKSYYWLYAFAIASLSYKKYPAKTMINVFLLGLFFTVVVCITQFAGIIPQAKENQFGFINPITYILFLVFGMLLLSFYFRKAQKVKHKILCGVGILLYFLNIFLFIGTPGRTGYLTFILMTPLIVYNLLGQKHIFKITTIGFLIIVILFLSPIVQDILTDTRVHIKMYYQGNPNTSVGLRLHMWKGAIKIFLENPIIGVGTGGYQSAMKKYNSSLLSPDFQGFSQPHNSFLHMAVNFGTVGIISLCWIFFVFLKAGWEHKNNLIGFSILSFGIVVLIGSLTDTQILQVHTGILFAFFTGLQKALDER